MCVFSSDKEIRDSWQGSYTWCMDSSANIVYTWTNLGDSSGILDYLKPKSSKTTTCFQKKRRFLGDDQQKWRTVEIKLLLPVTTIILHYLTLKMATAKRSLESEGDVPDSLKKFRSDETENAIEEFLEWCKNGNLILSDKV